MKIKVNHNRILRLLFAASVIGAIAVTYTQANNANAAGPVRGAGNYKTAPSPGVPPPPF